MSCFGSCFGGGVRRGSGQRFGSEVDGCVGAI